MLKTSSHDSAYPGQSSWKRFIARAVTDHLFSNSAFFVVARKRD